MINVCLELLVLTTHTSHTCQSPHKMGFTILITTSTFRGVSGYCQTKPENKSFTCLETYLETNSMNDIAPIWKQNNDFDYNLFLQVFFWTKPLNLGGPPLASTNPSSTLPWTTDRAPRRYASRPLPPGTSRRKAWVSAGCWDPFKVRRILGTTWWVNHGLKGSCPILRRLFSGDG